MNFDDIFAAMYTLYRAEADTPDSTDDEYTIAMRLANEAVQRWANYDGVYWKELFTTALQAGEAPTLQTSVTTYDCPDDFREAGGFVKVLNSSNNTVKSYPILNPEEAQFRNDNAQYAYFTGDPGIGWTLNLNPAPDSAINGLRADYVYYKKPTLFTAGSDETEMANPYYVVHRVLANRFRASRNPYYSSALRDAEDALSIMKMDNDSGTWANPWKLPDTSGSTWGGADTSQRIF